MQSQITSFFKSKETPKKKPQDAQEDKAQDETKSNTPTKRSSPDEEDTFTPEKRLAVSSSNNTPIKLVKVEHPVMTTTPLMDVNSLIQKKISSGAYALHENIGISWFRALQAEFVKPYFKKLSEFLKKERQSNVIFPPPDKVYTWTHFHEIRQTRVLILGQDPYHQPGQAHGLSFSVQKGVRCPPSLVNIFKELENDIPGFKAPPSGDLTGWAKQGVLMLNTCLTVRKAEAFSHKNQGWETFTDAVISWISKNVPHKVVFILWGRPAQLKEKIIDKRHKILKSAHPSPLSAHNGFFGCGHFSQTNKFLKEQKLPEVDWKAL